MKTLKFHSSHPSGGQCLTLIQDPEGRVDKKTLIVSGGSFKREGGCCSFVSDEDIKLMLSRSLVAEITKSNLAEAGKDVYLDRESSKVLFKYQAYRNLT